MIFEFICPSCDSDLTVTDGTEELVTCPECKKRIRICFDSDYENGRWVDCSSLSIADE